MTRGGEEPPCVETPRLQTHPLPAWRDVFPGGGAGVRAVAAYAAAGCLPVSPGGGGGGSQDGGQAADPDGQREAQQEHHAARERRQDLEERARGEGVGGAVAVGALHLRGVRIGYFSDYSEYQDGHVKKRIFKQDG